MIRLEQTLDELSGGRLLGSFDEAQVITPDGRTITTKVELWEKDDKVYMKGDGKGSVGGSSIWKSFIKKGVNQKSINLLIQEFGESGTIIENVSLALKRSIKNKEITIDEINQNQQKFKDWIDEYKALVNNPDPYEWGLRFLSKKAIFNIINLESFKSELVDKFPTSIRRSQIFNDYKQYIKDLKAIIGEDTKFTQLIGGSFVSNKLNPGDIDFIVYIPYESFYLHEEALKTLSRNSRNKIFGGEKTLEPTHTAIFPVNHTKYERKFKKELDNVINFFGSDRNGNILILQIIEF